MCILRMMGFLCYSEIVICHSERSEDVLLNEVKNLGSIHKYIYVDVPEILPPFGRLNDIICVE